MEPTNRSIGSLVEMFLNRELLLPEMQRKYVWAQTQARDLLDSIYRDYPSGSILIWETECLPEFKDHPFPPSSQAPLAKKLLLLDGQQRITSLASILEGQPIRTKDGRKIKEKQLEIYFNVDHPDEDNLVDKEAPIFEEGNLVEAKWEDGDFYSGKILRVDGDRYYIEYDDGREGWSDEVRDLGDATRRELFFQILSKKIANKPNWISVTKLFKEGVGSVLRELKMGSDDFRFDKYNTRLNQLYGKKKNYMYPIQIIRNHSYQEVTNIFIRVNSSGTRLRGTDLALAQITSVWSGSMRLFEDFVDDCAEHHFYFDLNFIAKCLIALSSNQPRFDQVGRMYVSQLRQAWDLAQRGIQNTINFLKHHALVDSSAVLPSPNPLIPLICYSATKNLAEATETERGFLRWFYNASMWGRYSGSTDTKLSQDLTVLRDKKPWEKLTENLWDVIGRDRKVEATDVRGKSSGSPLFFMTYILARHNKAIDPENGSLVNYSNFGKTNSIEFDHIFPKSKLEKHYENREKRDKTRLINELANLAFLTKKGNIIKSNDDPTEYFPRVASKHGPRVFDRQSIPNQPAILTYDKYETFLQMRAELIASNMNEFLEKLPISDRESSNHTQFLNRLNDEHQQLLKSMLPGVVQKYCGQAVSHRIGSADDCEYHGVETKANSYSAWFEIPQLSNHWATVSFDKDDDRLCWSVSSPPVNRKHAFLSAGYKEWRKNSVYKYVTLSSEFISVSERDQRRLLCELVEHLLEEDEQLRGA